MPSPWDPLLHFCDNEKCTAVLDIAGHEPFSEVCCPSCKTSQRVRKQFDHFELLSIIASGGMGTIYRARDVNLNRVVALKLLRKEYSADNEYIDKLKTEAKITAAVAHPHVVKVFSFGYDQGLYYIAMELAEKGSLDDMMAERGKIDEAQTLETGIQVAKGLRAAYQAGLIHRDVKPGNILYTDEHTAKIVDFGLATPLEQVTNAGEDIWGTPFYIAPEKLTHAPEDFRSDIYSLGATLYHALVGEPPFDIENVTIESLMAIKSQEAILQDAAPDVSGTTAYVINRMMANDPDRRYGSYDEVVDHLEYAKGKLAPSDPKPQLKSRNIKPELRKRKKSNWVLVIVAPTAAFVLLIIALLVFRDHILDESGAVPDFKVKIAEAMASPALSANKKADGPSSNAALANEKALGLLRGLQTDEAKQALAEAPGTPSESESRAILLKEIAYVERFKALLIEASKDAQIDTPLERMAGAPISGAVTSADSLRLQMKTGGIVLAVSWSEFTANGLLQLADALCKGGLNPVAADADLLWASGVYAGVAGRPAQAKLRMAAAAALKPQYKADLGLFDHSP